MSTESEFAEHADRASAVVHDQITAMIDAARRAALDIERRARQADHERRRADQEAEAVVAKLRVLEAEVSVLLSHVVREADVLEDRRERSRARAESSVVMRPSTEGSVPQDEPRTTPEEEAPATQVHQAVVVEEPDEAPKAIEPPSKAVAVPATAAVVSEEPKREPPSLEVEARTRVAAANDLELADLHRIAGARASKGSDEDRAYWRTLLTATVDEAVNREHFGQAVANDQGAGRRETKKRMKALRPLMSARQNALRDSAQG